MSAFTPAGSGGLPPPSVSIAAATTPTIANVSILLAATEYSYVLPTGTTQFLIRLRGYSSRMQLAYTALGSGTLYVTIDRGAFLAVGDLNLATPVTLYFQADAASQIAEIQSWY